MKKHILITNDDGIQAAGLLALEQALAAWATVTVVAPDRNQSAVSASLTTRRAIPVLSSSPQRFSVQGTPCDCIKLATSGLVEQPIDWVISGINHGPNLGDDVLYSGTVAAAMDAHLAGIPALAVSLAAGSDFTQAANWLSRFLQSTPLESGSLWNINIPKSPTTVSVTTLGRRPYKKQAEKWQDPRGNEAYWLMKPEPVSETTMKEGSDFYAIHSGSVSLTPLRIDQSDDQAADLLRHSIAQTDH